METTLPRIALVGTGNMSGAIVQGLMQPHVHVERIQATTRSEASAQSLRARGVDAVSLESEPDANSSITAQADIIVVGVKPYQILEVLADLSGRANPGATIVSVAAGITTSSMEEIWPGAIVRAMPNTPSQVGKGVTGLARGTRVSDSQLSAIETLFATVGQVLVVDEADINALSSISGSGPAYVYLFMEHLIEAAKGYGFSEEHARIMVEGTFVGALDALAASEKTPEQLRIEVTSPGGSTAAALGIFEQAHLREVFSRATAAAIARAEEMAAE